VSSTQLVGRFETLGVYTGMSQTKRPTGHLQVKLDKNGRTRSFWAFWRDRQGRKGGRCLGPAHVRDSGRRTPRGAVVWRAGHGPKPGSGYLTPKDAEARLEAMLEELRAATEVEAVVERTLQQAVEGWLAERKGERGLKRSTVAGYEDMFERMFRDLGAETPVRSLADGRLRAYFADFMSYRVLSEAKARDALAEGKNVQQLTIERWTAQPADSQAIEVATKDEAVRLADELPGTWKHRRRGCYRVVPLDAQRPRRVSRATAMALQSEGWIVKRRTTRPWMLVTPAAAQTRNTYRDILAASLDYAVREGWLDANPLDSVKRASKRHERERILRRDDFYDPEEIDRLLRRAPSVFEEAFLLCGAHAGFRLPGEALGLRWGAVDFQTGVMRPYDNWVRNEIDTTKTSDSEAIPMTPRLARALAQLRGRGFATHDHDFVFVSELTLDSPVSERPLRDAFKAAVDLAGLKPIKMYNLRHSFGTTLARSGIDIRTVQALMRHDRLSTTEQYMAYSPRPDLAAQIARALDPHSLADDSVSVHAPSDDRTATFFERLEEDIPAKWLREVQRLVAETGALS
jgi:integrase